MFDPQDNRWGENAARRPRGGVMRKRVEWSVFRTRMIQFAKYVAVESLNSTASIEEIVDAWLESTPVPPPAGDE